MKRDYDVIIAGGGLAGTIAAQSVHKYSGGNLSILVIDRSPEHMPGSKSRMDPWCIIKRIRFKLLPCGK